LRSRIASFAAAVVFAATALVASPGTPVMAATNWTLNQWNVVLPPANRSGSARSQWVQLQSGLTAINVRMDVTNNGSFTAPFNVHPWNDPNVSVAYLLETSTDGTDANAATLAAATSQGSPTGVWGTGKFAKTYVMAGGPVPTGTQFIRASYSILDASTIEFGVSVNPGNG
jgi:hypothetical protein